MSSTFAVSGYGAGAWVDLLRAPRVDSARWTPTRVMPPITDAAPTTRWPTAASTTPVAAKHTPANAMMRGITEGVIAVGATPARPGSLAGAGIASWRPAIS